MEKNKKKIRVLWFGVVIALSFALGASKGAFALSDATFHTLYVLLVMFIFGSGMMVNQLWYREFAHTVNALRPILNVEKDPDRFILENEKLLVGKKSAHIQAILRINLCVGYCEKGDYKEAERQLEAINCKKIYGVQRMTYLADCAYVAFYLQKTEQAIAFMEQNRKKLAAFQNSQAYGGLIAVLHIFELLDEPEKARALYEVARARWENEINRVDFDYLKRQLWAADTL